MERLDYFVRRLLLIIPTFLAITVVCFVIIQLVPGGPVEQYMLRLRGMNKAKGADAVQLTEEQLAAVKKRFHFDEPIYKRYWIWLYHERLGMTQKSVQYTDRTAWQLIFERFGVSLIFGLSGLLLSYFICIPLGIVKAIRNGSLMDISTSIIVFIGYSIPAFAFGMLLLMVFCGTVDGMWDLFPIGGFVSDGYEKLSLWGKITDVSEHMFLPVLCYVIGSFAVLTILTKNSLLEEVSKDYVRTVMARGARPRRAIVLHAMRNSLIPVVTGLGGILTIMFAGSVVIERVFNIPGMGRLSLEAIESRDYPVFMCILVLTTILGLLGNVLSDFLYVVVDPRINFQKS